MPGPAGGQWRDRTPSWPEAPAGMIAAQGSTQAPVPATPLVLSLVLPGAGQHVLGQRRKWVYLALEAAGWAAYLNRRHAGSSLRDRYRDFAWENGRIQVDGRVDGPFAYYEALSKWTRSGAFDSDAGTPGVQPELDPVTYNGSIWDRATRIFFPGGEPVPETDPAYQSALGYYSGHAYGAEFLWDWSAAPEAQQEFANLIHQSDHRFSQATTVLGLVIANHLISAGDAYLSARGRGGGARLRLVPGERTSGPGWWAVLRVPLGG
jgi:hypothetical protein